MINTESQLFPGFNDSDNALISNALDFSAAFKDQKTARPKGLDVAALLFKFNVDVETLLAALLSEPLLRNKLDNAEIEEQFGLVVASLVRDVTWLNTLSVYTPEMANQPNQAETLRRMLLSMTHDVRAVLIKLAFRAQRLKSLANEEQQMRHFVARETLDIYAPIASRLGIGQLKWELEDKAFRFLEPRAYQAIAKSLAEDRKQRESCIDNFVVLLRQALNADNINAEVFGRPKHIYSIWKKMQRKQLGIDELFDLLAVRIIVDDLSACYAVLGIAHSQWQYIPREFDDYIANPKKNGYQSLHTVVIDSEGNRIEIQIRTKDMNEFAELGIAAHWRYKEGGKLDKAADKCIATLRQALAENENNEGLVDDFRTELFSDRVYTLTPNGKLIDLIKGATPLDFAYSIHSEVGHRCRGAKVNHRIVPLTYTLKSGDRVEILTAKEVVPNYNWIDPNLGYLKTSRAINKVKTWFRQQKQEQNETAGKQILAREIQRLGLNAPDMHKLAMHFKHPTTDKLMSAIGRGDVSTQQLAGFLQIPASEKVIQTVTRQVKPSDQNSTVIVQGLNNVVTHYAQCCNPVPGDKIIGYISQTRGIIIHRTDCQSLIQLSPKQQTRLIESNWGEKEPSHAVPVVVYAYDRQGLLNDVTRILDQAKINIIEARSRKNDDVNAILELTLQINNTEQLSQVLAKICQIPDIYEAQRKR